MTSRSFFIGALLVAIPGAVRAQAAAPTLKNPLARTYREGEALHYHMHGVNESRTGTVRYDADAIGRVVRDSAGHFVDSLEWNTLVENGTARLLHAGSASVQQRLAFAPGFLIVPDLAHTDPGLTAEVLDLFTFYVDLWFGARSPAIGRVGDEVRIPGRGSNSWAAGTSLLVGSDAVDFIVTLSAVDSATHQARVLIRHVAPDSAGVALPAEWMRAPLAGAPNNWVQVEAAGPDFIAGVGHETFDVWLTVDLRTGEFLHATMDNPVDVLERRCTDKALSQCTAPVTYRIRRLITVDRVE